MKTGIRRMIIVAVSAVFVMIFVAGCGNNVSVTVNTQPADSGSGIETYKSNDGWSVTYDASVITVNEDKDCTSFVYTGDSAGTNMLTISYKQGAKPEETIDELAAGWGDADDVTKSESYFPGTTDKWGFWRTLLPASEGSGLAENAFAGEYNGGVLIFEFVTHNGGNADLDRTVRDTLIGIMDSITYDDFEPQTMYQGFAGIYTLKGTEEIEGKDVSYEYSVKLNEDHSGEIKMQDDIYVMWGSHYLIQADNSYDYTCDGQTLTIDMDGNKMEFTRM